MRAEPGPTQHPRETECDAVAAVHDELQADEEARERAHDEHGGGPGGPRDGAEEDDEREDGDDERDEGQTRGEREEEVRAVQVPREILGVCVCWSVRFVGLCTGKGSPGICARRRQSRRI